MKRLLLIFLVMTLAACGNGKTDDTVLPTLLELPIEEGAVTATPPPIAEVARSTLPATWTITPDPTITETLTVTPSMTITDTPTPTATNTATETLEPNPLFGLVGTALNATVPPTRPFIPTETATAQGVIVIGQTPGSIFPTQAPVTQCQYPPPGGFNQAFTNDTTLVNQIGCPVGAPPTAASLATAVQGFERGTMIWLGDGSIYVLFSGGAYQRFDDTYQAGVDPESGGQTPPDGLIEPVRGFGKVWRNNSLITSLGWATTGENPSTATVQDFARGRMLSIPIRGDIVILISSEASSGLWRSAVGQF